MDTTALPSRVRRARLDDAEQVVRLVRELALYEKALEQVHLDAEQVRRALRGPAPVAECLVAEVDGAVVGMALWYRTFSTWEGEGGMHLEDLYVEEGRRGSGLGRDLLVGLARIATDRGLTRLEWDVLRWNTPSIRFYETLDAEPQDEWLGYRLSGKGLQALAES